MAPTLAYWDIRGLANPLRMLLEYVGVEYENVMYKTGPAPDYDRSEWTKVKFTLGLDFPNLPYYIDGDIKITQSHGILRYLARKHGLEGKTDVEKARADMMVENSMDFRNAFVKMSYNVQRKADWENEVKVPYINEFLPTALKGFSDFLGDRKFFASDEVTAPDFHMYEMLYSNQQLAPEVVAKFPNLVAFIERFEKIPQIEKFLKSDRNPKAMNNRMAKFGA